MLSCPGDLLPDGTDIPEGELRHESDAKMKDGGEGTEKSAPLLPGSWAVGMERPNGEEGAAMDAMGGR